MFATPHSTLEITSEQLDKIRIDCLSSLLYFTRLFFKLRFNRDFQMSKPEGRESHFITLARELTKVFTGETKNLLIEIAPRYGKTEFIINFITWALAQYPDSNFLYISYAHMLATKQTQTIRDMVQMPIYQDLFSITLNPDSTAKDHFITTDMGSVFAAGSRGTITGFGAGLKGCDRFSGAIIIDDIHKPVDVHSDTVRESDIDWYSSTLLSRRNDGENTPIIVIGQRLHEQDLPSQLEKENFHVVKLQSLDEAGNALYPEMHSKQQLLEMKNKKPYLFFSQYQQEPTPAGGALYREDDFVLLDEDPLILKTFITGDSAESEKEWADYTVFSFWGIYKIIQDNIDTGLYGLHWLGCEAMHIEPRDLEQRFLQFYTGCMSYKVKPMQAAIEKKSTGVMLCSVLKKRQGLEIIEIEPTVKQGSKNDRFVHVQPYVASRHISFSRHSRHTNMCIEHCKKITANGSQPHDDIADTLQVAIDVALIRKVILMGMDNQSQQQQSALSSINAHIKTVSQLRGKMYGYNN